MASTGAPVHDEASAWALVLAAAASTERCVTEAAPKAYAVSHDGTLQPVAAGDADAVLSWLPGRGWLSRLDADHPQYSLLDLYLPVCNATAASPITVGHLGQSLDGFIATHSGDSQFVTGPENLRHMHRMRALCDAIVVGAGTVAADDPQLTTRHVAGTSPVRVIFDPQRRLGDHYKVFTDDAAETIYVCARSLVTSADERLGAARVVALDDKDGRVDLSAVIGLLRRRGCSRIFVEGGGVTVSNFLEANLLDRLQVAVAPLIIGDGRPAVRLQQPPAMLRDCRRPRYRVFRMGGDILFDCDLRAPLTDGDPDGSPLTRVI